MHDRAKFFKILFIISAYIRKITEFDRQGQLISVKITRLQP